MKILIFEDEIPAYEKLLSQIEKEIPEAHILAWARSVTDGIHFLKKHPEIDLIFADIQLIDGTSFDVFEEITIDSPIIFCTAFDKYLLEAFQTNGIAYLLKPFDDESFASAIKKFKSLFNNKIIPIEKKVISELRMILDADKKSYKKRFTIKKKGGIKLLNVGDVPLIEANGDFCVAYDSMAAKHILNSSLRDLEEKLDPKVFFRINRSEIVNIEHIESINSYFKNKLLIKLKKLGHMVYTSSAKTKDFRQWLDQS